MASIIYYFRNYIIFNQQEKALENEVIVPLKNKIKLETEENIIKKIRKIENKESNNYQSHKPMNLKGI